ncbi:transcription factor DP1 (TFDP1) [Vairimorpha necatrix]|uniref:Transcription factor DP1 (TFDP1) n=1 Tax=Vairimorpha necatrix TaxID=6039 RepID=A0AAX4JBK9_9MICR
MKNLYSDIHSENKKDGMKYITNEVYNIIKSNDGVTYTHICENIQLPNKKTLHRRIYDVLNVMKAVQIVDKKNKKFYLTNNQDSINKKKEDLSKLQDMKNIFEYLVNKNRKDDGSDKLYLPFMIIKTKQDSNVHCDTNEERSFFTFKSSHEIELVEDLEILKELYFIDNSKSIGNNSKEFLDNIFF